MNQTELETETSIMTLSQQLRYLAEDVEQQENTLDKYLDELEATELKLEVLKEKQSVLKKSYQEQIASLRDELSEASSYFFLFFMLLAVSLAAHILR
jgi:sulfur carrier protein ThiS